MKDILITASVNNISEVLPQTEKAKKVFANEKSLKGKMSFSISKRDAIDVLAWAVSHDLSVESKIQVVVKPHKEMA